MTKTHAWVISQTVLRNLPVFMLRKEMTVSWNRECSFKCNIFYREISPYFICNCYSDNYREMCRQIAQTSQRVSQCLLFCFIKIRLFDYCETTASYMKPKTLPTNLSDYVCYIPILYCLDSIHKIFSDVTIGTTRQIV